MQNSEFLRQAVVVPLDDAAEESLRCNDVDETTRVECLRVWNDALFTSLWSIGLFDEINRRCKTLIDEYEEGFVEVPDVHSLIHALEGVRKQGLAGQTDVNSFLADLHGLAMKALELGRPILFVM